MTVYTETVLHGAEPFQLVIVTRDDGSRVTGRIAGERVSIGDEVREELQPEAPEVAIPGAVPYFKKLSSL